MFERSWTGSHTNRPPAVCKKKVPIVLLSVHVDDIKTTGLPNEIEKLLKILTDHFDELKLERDNFEHLGLKHTLEADGSRSVSQEHYVQELKLIAEAGCHHDNPVGDSLKMQYMLLVAWRGQCRHALM